MSTLELISALKEYSSKSLGVENLLARTKLVSSCLSKVAPRIWITASLSFSFEIRNLVCFSRWELGVVLSVPISEVSVFISLTEAIKEKNMEESIESLGIPVDVSIGQVDLSLVDLLSLEKGQCIVTKMEPQNTVALMIAGEIVAHASFEVEGEMILLKINEIFLHENGSRIDNVR